MSDVERITLERKAQFKPARDAHFRLVCGAAVSATRNAFGDLDRARILTHVGGLVERGVDVVAVSTAHGHSKGVGDTVKVLRDAFPKLPIYAGEHDRIIDQETWDRVHETLQHNGSTKGATVRNKLGALLRGLLFCVPCGTPMMHTYTMRKSKRYRYYVCYNAQQQGWQNCETKSVSAQAIETAVLDSIRRIGTDPKLAEAVAAEALDQMARRRRDLDQEFDTHRRSLRQSNQALAREAGDTSVDSGARFDRIVGIQKEIETTEHRLTELAAERKACDQDRINANDLRSTLAEFDSIWSSLTTREQEQRSEEHTSELQSLRHLVCR